MSRALALAGLDKEDGTFQPLGAAGVYHTGDAPAELQQQLNKHGISAGQTALS
jgi:hypothetical protein